MIKNNNTLDITIFHMKFNNSLVFFQRILIPTYFIMITKWTFSEITYFFDNKKPSGNIWRNSIINYIFKVLY